MEQLRDSDFSKCQIVIMNNSSTDSTQNVFYDFSKDFVELSIINHQYNIGANANILRSLEMCEKDYCWVLADDDDFDFSFTQDVKDALIQSNYKLIHVGGHDDNRRTGGSVFNINDLISKGYPFFKYGSFIPSNIIKKDFFLRGYLVAGYNNIANSYPHMPFLQGLYLNNDKIYVSRNRIVTPGDLVSSYDSTSWFLWWMRTADLFKLKRDRRLFFNDHFVDGFGSKEKILMAKAAMSGFRSYLEIKSFILRTLSLHLILVVDIFIIYNYFAALSNRIREGKLWGIILYYRNKLKSTFS